MSRLAFYRGEPPDAEPEGWAGRHPGAAGCMCFLLLSFIIIGLGALCALLDAFPKGG